jgi:hypothetical protein
MHDVPIRVVDLLIRHSTTPHSSIVGLRAGVAEATLGVAYLPYYMHDLVRNQNSFELICRCQIFQASIRPTFQSRTTTQQYPLRYTFRPAVDVRLQDLTRSIRKGSGYS